MRVESFIGPSNRLASVIADAEELINFCIESVAPGQAKSDKYIRNAPCVSPFLQTGEGGTIRGLFTINNRTFAVSGTVFGEVFWDGVTATWTAYGTVDSDDEPVSMVSNGTAGNQILITSALVGYVFDMLTNTLATAQSLDPNFPDDVILCEFLKGYGIVLIRNTRRWRISALEDFGSWDLLDVAEISDFSGNLESMVVVRDTIRFLGNQQGESWYANGDPLFPFAPIPGSMVNVGTTFAFAATRVGNTVAYVAKDQFGNGMVRIDDGVETNRVSTYAVEYDLRLSTRLEDARMFVHQDQGHLFVWLILTDRPWSWVYDITEGRWHKRAIWNPVSAEYLRYVADNYTFAFVGHPLVGSYLNDVIYEMSFQSFADELVS